jgi:hypothetical protein
MGFGNMQSGGGSVSWTDITGKPLEFAPLMGNLGNFLFVSPTGSGTQTRTQGIGRIDKPFTLARAVAVHQNNDVIFIFGDTAANYASITLNNTGATAKTLRLMLVDASILDVNINNTGGGAFTVYLIKSGSSGLSRVRNNLNLAGSNLKIISDCAVGGSINITGNNNQYIGKNHEVSSTLSVTGNNANISLENCSIFLEMDTSNTLTTLDVQGGSFGCRVNGLIAGAMRIVNSKSNRNSMVEFFGTTVSIGADIEVFGCLNYENAGILVKIDAVATWTDIAKKLKIINSVARGSIQNAVAPSIVAQIDTYNSVVI